MADDAGALLVRSGLVSSSALDEARARVGDLGGTLGEQLVSAGAVDDEALTNFYKQRLLVPQVNPNMLARLPAKVVAVIPSDMAIELRAIPVSLDADNNLTIAMSDPSNRHAVDEIAFFTGAYVVRAVATQMQIAWCLAHYYGHVTNLGERLLEPEGVYRGAAPRMQAEAPRPRTRGDTGKVVASRHKTVAPGESIDVARPTSRMLDAQTSGPILTLEEVDGIEGSGPMRRDTDVMAREIDAIGGDTDPMGRDPDPMGRDTDPVIPAASDSDPVIEMMVDGDPVIEIKRDSDPSIIEMEADAGRPNELIINVELDSSQPVPKRRRPADPDPPELAARAGEVQLATGEAVKKIDFDEPPIVVSDDLKPVPSRQVSGEVPIREHRDRPPSGEVPSIFVELGEASAAHAAAVIYDELEEQESRPLLLDRRRAPYSEIFDEDDPVVVLPPKRLGKRGERRTQLGVGLVGAVRARLASPPAGVPTAIDSDPTDVKTTRIDDAMRLDARAAPARDDDTGETVAAPPAPSGRDTPREITPSGRIPLDRVRRAPSVSEEDELGKPTSVMSAVELDEAIPGRSAEILPPRHAASSDDDDDDQWGPPGTTIPPPLLGAIPGAITPASGIIPIPDIDSAPLMVAPPTPPERGMRSHSPSEQGISRALESATARVLELIHTLDHTCDRDQIIAVMIAHLAESHRRAGFFAMRAGALSLFAITPRIPQMPTAQLRLDRPSTLQDVVGTRLPYRGPMLDDTSRQFLAQTLGACPPEILLVPITVREKVVGVLFGDQRVRHTFDDQLALAARAAGMALEALLRTRRR